MKTQTSVEKKERPIIFGAESVRAILEGRKTMTRRLKGLGRFNHQPDRWRIEGKEFAFDGGFEYAPIPNCPYGKVGDRLWVRETFLDSDDYPCSPHHEDESISRWLYRADIEDENKGKVLIWKPSIHMPRVASRIKLKITNIHVERLQKISIADIESEGVSSVGNYVNMQCKTKYHRDCIAAFCDCFCHQFEPLWNKINGADSWNQNPLVWCISFKKI